jgi:hypothetical protein
MDSSPLIDYIAELLHKEKWKKTNKQTEVLVRLIFFYIRKQISIIFKFLNAFLFLIYIYLHNHRWVQ